MSQLIIGLILCAKLTPEKSLKSFFAAKKETQSLETQG